MPNKEISSAAIAAARKRANELHNKIKEEKEVVLTPRERDDAAPFYFTLRAFIQQLKEAREAAGLTLADISQRTGMAVESLSRLETGAQTNPTWKTLGLYAKAVDRQPHLVARASDRDKHQADEARRRRAGSATSSPDSKAPSR